MMTKYSAKKTGNQEVSMFTDKHLMPKSQQRFCECGNWIDFFADREVSKLKVYQANFCKNRFCPMCAWRLAHKDALKISVLMDYIEAEHGMAFIFVTLTAPNVRAENLRDEITRYNKAFKRLVERDEIAKINRGYIRKIEVTYNQERDDYHPHFHCVFAVNPSYFKSRDYIKQDRWLYLWRDVMRDSSITQVDVRRVKKNGGGADGRNKAINELAKYAAKDKDFAISQEVFDVFYAALKGRQFITFNGLFAEANKMYKAKKLEHYKTLDTTEYVWLLLYRWGALGYTEERRGEIDPAEYAQLKKDAVDEMAIG
jgi:plasmid rolling circle replication initiator protein Rep